VELQVVGHQVLDAGMRPEPVEQRAQLRALLRGDPLGRHGGGRGLEDAAHPEELQHGRVAVEIHDEAERLEQQRGLQAGHVGAVALPHVQDVHQ
jgi:hypothetical protein